MSDIVPVSLDITGETVLGPVLLLLLGTVLLLLLDNAGVERAAGG